MSYLHIERTAEKSTVLFLRPFSVKSTDGLADRLISTQKVKGRHRLGAALLRFPTICGRRILFLIRRFYREINGKGTGTNEKR